MTLADMSSGKIHVSMDGDDTEMEADNIVGHLTDDVPPQAPFKTDIKEQPVTQERKPYAPQTGDRLTNAGTARATIAASQESPNGTTEGNYARDHQHQTVLTSSF